MGDRTGNEPAPLLFAGGHHSDIGGTGIFCVLISKWRRLIPITCSCDASGMPSAPVCFFCVPGPVVSALGPSRQIPTTS